MIQSEEDKRKAFERSNAYKNMFELWAWKDFQTTLTEMKAQTVNDFINFDEREAVEFKAGQFKGTLDCLNRIQKELEMVLEGV